MTEIKNKALMRVETSFAGPVFMLSAALLFTLANILIKLLRPEFTVWHIGFFRFFGGMLILLSVFGRKGNPYRGKNVRLLVVRGCVGSITFICLITAIRLLPVSTAMVIF
jgi:drug/metabolite transporter (DMT)-like permease